MNKRIVKTDSEGFINIEQFSDLFDINEIVYYLVKEENGIIKIMFYDKDKNFITPKEDKDEKK